MLTISFRTWIKDLNTSVKKQVNGPIFTRWLPNGETDAIKIPSPAYSATVFLWFERHGSHDEHGFIRYEKDCYDIDPEAIPRQKKLYAGHLYVKVKFDDVPESLITAITTDDSENEQYIKFGKILVKKITAPILSKITNILRNTYGQYWIKQIENYDSRTMPLSNYCHYHKMKWELVNGDSGFFLPGKLETLSIGYSAGESSELEFINKDEWFKLENLLNRDFDPSLSSSFASRANQLLFEGRLSHSLIEAVIALELSLEEYVRGLFDSSAPELNNIASGFWKCNLPTKIGLVGCLIGVPGTDIKLAIEGVNKRNSLVHDGKQVDDSIEKNIVGLLQTISKLNGPNRLKFPIPDGSNSTSHPQSD